MELSAHDALLIVDIQNDFCAGGALAVPGGEEVIPVVHKIAPLFACIVLTQDWHPVGHSSFASAHPGKSPYQEIEVAYGPQTLWPDHCIQGTCGAEFHPDLKLPQAELVQRKGSNPDVDSYSAFFENDRITATGLDGYLRQRGVQRVFLAGLAYDYCVAYSALDARRLGYEAVIVRDGCRAIGLGGSVERMEARLAQAGVTVLLSSDLIKRLK